MSDISSAGMGALAAAAGFEPRVAGAPGEERSEGRVLVAQGQLKRDGGHLGEPADC